MVVPLAVRDIAAVVGAVLVVTAAASEIGTIIVPRPIGSWLTHLVDRLVNGVYRMVTGVVADYHRRDRILAGQAAAILLCQLVAWLVIFFVGYSLLLWPFVTDITTAFTTAGPALWEIGSSHVSGAADAEIDVAARPKPAAAPLCSSVRRENDGLWFVIDASCSVIREST